MSIIQAELIQYQSANMPVDDVSTSGGGINVAGRADLFSAEVPSPAQTIKLASTNAGDTRTVTIFGRNNAGAIVSEAKALTGTTAVTTTQAFERISKITVSTTTTAGIVINVMRTNPADDGILAAIPADITSCQRMFYDSQSEASQAVRYEKLFWKNTNSTLTLNNATVKLTSNPLSKIKIALEASLNDTNSVANRKTVPSGGLTFVDQNSTPSVPTGAIPSGSAIGTWVQQTLAIADAAAKSSHQTQLTGTTT
jgi:hypothetical protein